MVCVVGEETTERDSSTTTMSPRTADGWGSAIQKAEELGASV